MRVVSWLGSAPCVLLIGGTLIVGLYARHSRVEAALLLLSVVGGPLDEGTIEGDTVTCPWHGSVFCVRDGALIHGPATAAAPAFDVRVQDGRIAVRSRE